MPSLFNIIRGLVFVAALVCSIVVLAIAALLQGVLEPSDLTRFIAIAIFVSVITLVFVCIILYFGWRTADSLISQARSELILSGLLGGFWAGLSIYLLAQPESDVECPDQDDGDAASYNSDIFHAQYHVLQAFSILATALLLGYTLFFFVLAWRHHRAGRKQVWNGRVTLSPWLVLAAKSAKPSDGTEDKFTRLPPPVAASSKPRRFFGFGHRRTSSTGSPSGEKSSAAEGRPLMHTRSRSSPAAPYAATILPTYSNPAPVAALNAPPALVLPTSARQPPVTSAAPATVRPQPRKAQTYVVYAPAEPSRPTPVPPPSPPRRAGTTPAVAVAASAAVPVRKTSNGAAAADKSRRPGVSRSTTAPVVELRRNGSGGAELNRQGTGASGGADLRRNRSGGADLARKGSGSGSRPTADLRRNGSGASAGGRVGHPMGAGVVIHEERPMMRRAQTTAEPLAGPTIYEPERRPRR